MTGKVITVVFIFILLLFVYFVFKDSKIKIWKPEIKEWKNPLFSPTLAFGPTIYIRNDKEKEKGYQKYEVKKPSFKIGKGVWCDLRINEPYVAGRQAEIRQRRENDEIYFTLTNLGRVDNMEYLEQDKMRYRWMGYKDEVELGEKEVFYLGDIKLFIRSPQPGHAPAKSDRFLLDNKDMEEIGEKSTDREYDVGWDDVQSREK